MDATATSDTSRDLWDATAEALVEHRIPRKWEAGSLTDKLFNMVDKNHDGQISRNEFRTAVKGGLLEAAAPGFPSSPGGGGVCEGEGRPSSSRGCYTAGSCIACGTDCELRLGTRGGPTLRAHSAVLAARSALLAQRLRGAGPGEPVVISLELPAAEQVQESDLDALLRYLYLGDLADSVPDPCSLVRLWPLLCGPPGSGGALLVTSRGLRGAWLQRLRALLTRENVAPVLAVAEQGSGCAEGGLEACMEVAARFALRHGAEVLRASPNAAAALGRLPTLGGLLWQWALTAGTGAALGATAWRRVDPVIKSGGSTGKAGTAAKDATSPPSDVHALLLRGNAAACVLTSGAVLVAGGREIGGGNRRLSDVWRSDDNGQTWRLVVAAAPWGGRTDHRLVETEHGTLILLGGNTDGGVVAGDLWRSEDEGLTWRCAFEVGPWCARAAPMVVRVRSGAILIICGERRNSKEQSLHYLKDLWCSRDHGVHWHRVREEVPWLSNGDAARNARGVVVATLYGDVLALTGHDVWRSEDEGATWARAAVSGELPWEGYTNRKAAAVSRDGAVLFAASRTHSEERGVWRSWDEGVSWRRVAEPAPPAQIALLGTRDGGVLSLIPSRSDALSAATAGCREPAVSMWRLDGAGDVDVALNEQLQEGGNYDGLRAL